MSTKIVLKKRNLCQIKFSEASYALRQADRHLRHSSLFVRMEHHSVHHWTYFQEKKKDT